MKIAVTMGFSEKQYFINQAYINYLLAGGYTPLPIVEGCNIDDIASIADGLLLPGGIDVDPVYYNEENNSCSGTRPEFDEFERRCLGTFLANGKPVMGICRGLQLIAREFMLANPEFDGDLSMNNYNGSKLRFVQHVYDHDQNSQKTLFGDDSDLADEFVNSMHHQAIKVTIPKNFKAWRRLGSLEILAWTRRGMGTKDEGRIVEAFRIKGWISKTPVLAVQWHPEELVDIRLLHNFFGMPAGEGRKYANPGHVEVG